MKKRAPHGASTGSESSLPPLALMRLAMASISSVTEILIEKPRPFDPIPSLGAIVLIQADAHVAGLERDEHTLAVTFDGTLHAEAQDVVIPGEALLDVFHGERNGCGATELLR